MQLWRLTCFLGLANAATRASIDSALQAADLSPTTQVFYPTDKNYTSETIQRYTLHDAPTYVASVKPAAVEDVEKIVHACTTNQIPFLATGGGHGFTTTYGMLQQGLQIDLGRFDNVSVDKEASTLTIGSAVVFAQIFDPVFQAGKEIPTGSGVCVGMIGATIGGGVGRYIGLHGMIVDSLLSVDMITANGTRLTASKTENTDLFWAVRGAGSNFGIIMSATYQLYDLTSPNVMNWDLVFTLNQSAPLMAWLKSMEENQDPKLAPILLIGYNESYGGTYFLLNTVYAGPKAEGMRLIEPLLNKTGKPLVSNLSEPTWAEMPDRAFFGAEGPPCIKNQNNNVYGGSVNSYDLTAFDEFYHNLDAFFKATPNAQGSVAYVEHLAKSGPLKYSENETSYPWRNITAYLLYNYHYNDTSLESHVSDFAVSQRALVQNSSGFSPEQIYVSYGHGDEGPEAWYSSAFLPRLSALKSTWDPMDVFSFSNAIPQANATK